MAVFYEIEQLPVFHNAAITIGTFDGVHKGHKAILQEVINHAGAVGGESVLLTFEPHPRKVLFPQQPLGIITPLPQKLQLISDTGIQHIVVVPFTAAFAAMTASEYIEQFIVSVFQPHSIVIGYDHHFGNDRTGNIDLLRQYAPICNFEIAEIPAQLIEAAAVSSTKIRNAIHAGLIGDANAMLGRHYSFLGRVVHGNKLGRTIGYPTANLLLADADQVLPAVGIYAARVRVMNTIHSGMMSIGYNPTVTDSKVIKIEVNIFDFEQDIYDHTIEVYVVDKLRNEEKYISLERLKEQLHADKIATLKVLSAEGER
jgi:riboflavin kinase/FMN adenylyltransferase